MDLLASCLLATNPPGENAKPKKSLMLPLEEHPNLPPLQSLPQPPRKRTLPNETATFHPLAVRRALALQVVASHLVDVPTTPSSAIATSVPAARQVTSGARAPFAAMTPHATSHLRTQASQLHDPFSDPPCLIAPTRHRHREPIVLLSARRPHLLASMYHASSETHSIELEIESEASE